MKTSRLALLALMALPLCLVGTGCATTRLSVSTAEGTSVDFRFPKNLVARDIEVVVGPHSLRAAELRTDASAVIRTQAEVMRGLAEQAAEAAVR